MKAAIFHGAHQPLTVEEIEVDEPRAGEVLVRTFASGVCHTDLHYTDGFSLMPAPAVMGHEGAGVVEAVGPDVTYVQPGDHVIACLSVFCGQCEYCLSGRPNLCAIKPERGAEEPPRYRRGGDPLHQQARVGSHAELMLLHEHSIVKIREDMPLDRAALIGCGVTTGVGAALRTAEVAPGSSVAVFGCGGVGLSTVQGARIAGARQIIAVDVFEHKLAQARALGATHVVDASSRDPVQAIVDMTSGGVDYSFEAIGLSKVATQAFNVLRAGGTATLIGLIPVGESVEIPGWDLLREKKLQGSSMGSNRLRVDLPIYVDLYMQGRLKLDEMITRRGDLEEINDMFRAVKAGEVARSVIMFN